MFCMKNMSLLISALAFTSVASAQDFSATEKRGLQMYLHDHASAVVSDAVQPMLTADMRKHMNGYITEERGGAIVVSFVGTGDDGHRYAWFRAAVGPDGQLMGNVSRYDQPQKLSDYEEKAAAALRTATASKFAPCTPNYNTVVLPKEDGWQVYLLPGVKEKGMIPLGGAYRVDTDASGLTLLAQRGFTKTCVNLPVPDNAAALTITHLLDPDPTETHVFWQLWSRKPFFVVTVPNRSVWSIDKGHITFVQKLKDNAAK